LFRRFLFAKRRNFEPFHFRVEQSVVAG
jgi:hypothetical protein